MLDERYLKLATVKGLTITENKIGFSIKQRDHQIQFILGNDQSALVKLQKFIEDFDPSQSVQLSTETKPIGEKSESRSSKLPFFPEQFSLAEKNFQESFAEKTLTLLTWLGWIGAVVTILFLGQQISEPESNNYLVLALVAITLFCGALNMALCQVALAVLGSARSSKESAIYLRELLRHSQEK